MTLATSPFRKHVYNKLFVVLLEQVQTINRCWLREYIGHLDANTMELVDQAIVVSLGISPMRQEMKHQEAQ